MTFNDANAARPRRDRGANERVGWFIGNPFGVVRVWAFGPGVAAKRRNPRRCSRTPSA
jgi:hypothetical protein